MTFDNTAAQQSFRDRLVTLAAVSTGAANIGASGVGYTRVAGSFITDGFELGMELLASGFGISTNNGIKVVTSVASLMLGVQGGLAIEGAGATLLVVGLPEQRVWENVRLDNKASGKPYIEEQWIPQPTRMLNIPYQGGKSEAIGLYVIRWYAVEDKGSASITRPADAVVELFKAGTIITTGAGQVIRVRGRESGPYRGEVRRASPGWVVCTITIPWRAEYIN